jgi:L-iditol 2-dehydrogenase
MEGTMKQARLLGIGGPWEIKEVPIPKPGIGQVLIKTKVASLCKQTDLNTVKGLHPPHDHQSWGMLPHEMRLYRGWKEDPLKKYYGTTYMYPHTPFPTLMGHEMAGVVVELGLQATQPFGIDDFEGDFGGGWTGAIFGRSQPLEVGDHVSGSGVFGGFGEYGVMSAAAPGVLPKTMPFEIATFAENIMIILNVLRQVVEPGYSVLIMGQGALGGLSTMMAKYMGAGKIIVSDPVKSKRDLAIKRGAAIAIDPTTQNVVDEVMKATEGRGAQVVIEAAGLQDTIALIPYVAAFGAKVGQIGACCEPVTVDWSYIHFKGLQIRSQGSYAMRLGGTITRMEQEACDILTSGVLDIASLITHRFRLDDLPAIMKEAETNNEMIKALCIFD